MTPVVIGTPLNRAVMVSDRKLSRRKYLAGVVATTALAGCNSKTSSNNSSKGGKTSSASSTSSTGTKTSTTTSKASNTSQTSQSSSTTQQTTSQQHTNQPGSYKPMDQGAASFSDPNAWKPDSNVRAAIDTSNVYSGKGSLHVKGGGGTIRRHFPVPMDFSNKDLSVAIDVPMKQRPTIVRIWLQDAGGNWTKLLQQLTRAHPKGWIRINPSINSVGAKMDAIKTMLITVDHHPNRPTMEYWVDELRFNDKPSNKGQVSIMFDGIDSSLYTQGFPVMESYGFKGTIAVPAEQIGTKGHMSMDEINSMVKKGWEVACASSDYQKMTGVSPSTQKKKIDYAVGYLKKQGIKDISTFVYPWGACSKETIDLVSKNFDRAYLSFDGSEYGNSQASQFNPYFINRSRPNSPHAVNNQLKAIAPYRGVYTPYFMKFGTKDQNNKGEFENMCSNIAKYKNKGKVNVVTTSKIKALK